MLTFVCHFMKQKFYFQRGVAECRHAATPLSSYSINTTLQGFQKRYLTLLYLKGLKRYQQKCKWKVRFTKESGVKCQLVTFEPLEIQQSHIPLLKALMCGINAVGAQGCGCMFTFSHAYLKMGVLPHKMAIACKRRAMTVYKGFWVGGYWWSKLPSWQARILIFET